MARPSGAADSSEGFSYSNDFAWLRSELATAAENFARSLRQLNGATQIPDHAWTAGEVGAHVVGMVAFYRDMASYPDGYPLPESIDDLARANMDAVGTYDAGELADRVVPEFAEWVDELSADPTAPCGWWVPTDRQGVASAALGELILHRMDLARLTGEDVPLTRSQAIAVLEGVMPGGSKFADHDAAAGVSATYRVKLRGGSSWAIVVDDGDVVVSPGSPPQPDVQINADPVSMLLTSYGRANPILAGLTGKQVVYGRRPWKVLALQNIMQAP